MLTAVQTGLRISELLGLTRADTQLGTGAHVRTVGKGRKERVAPLTKQTITVLRAWLARNHRPTRKPAVSLARWRHAHPRRDRAAPRPTRRDRTARLRVAAIQAVTMHTMRHTAAMNLLTAGVDTSTIALWLGHEQERTTHIYLHADLALKQRTLDRITPPNGRPGRYRAPDSVINFLNNL